MREFLPNNTRISLLIEDHTIEGVEAVGGGEGVGKVKMGNEGRDEGVDQRMVGSVLKDVFRIQHNKIEV